MNSIIIKLTDIVDKNFEKTNESMFFLRNKIKSAIVDTKIENGGDVKVELEMLNESYNKYAPIINCLANAIISEWNE